ncbi:MAG: hypothetical protein A3G49_01570 [Candidatus Sungbacteria bacterium RIFCSPLOWO2_12_FULL_41_11]|uniref:Uncharacterized protein n=1 Tax=Candidatus Sungbacteria bacterium RIFCSPLOWO2_12_FULL_41_11 TaxID=1802286 RepID=A0A1G2LSZ4_9BACT|nr:MAG: hypothetical protein UV01_C0011G0032 [Parcubacteria group bacterium GW2011_GWA2_42_14]OHA13911.1 MAG: hypothetical protein A3G49_01570 [Candidatus Sungbacteria bacterium RIFCSPLOWO2_12_FULL_41_11]
MIINAKKSKMTLDKLVSMTQREFSAVRKEMATKDDLKHFATKDDLYDLKEEIRGDTAKILQGVDKIVTHFDKVEKDHAADKLLHDRHEKVIETLKQKVGVR